jgi:hypothetical protein
MRKTQLALVLGLSSLFLVGDALAAPHPDPRPPERGQNQQQQGMRGARHVDLVIALDTSSSMDGLIDSARQKLWDVVNVLSQARPQPILRVGLISYGNDGYDAHVGWVRKESDLTTDLDSVYARLFALQTNGGTEYVARAVHDATHTMKWSQDPKALKIIFVAGNEPATQDPQIPVDAAVKDARASHIFVNAIYCGTDGGGDAIGWREVARAGSGRYAAIDQNHTVAIATPEDAELAKLSGALNRTYIAYGHAGAERKKNQEQQDKNAIAAGAPAAASRAAAKSGGLYRADGWDLVDARAHGGKDIKTIPTAELPAPMQAMPPAAREAYVEGKAKERARIQKQIAEVSHKREGYLRAERAKLKPGQADLDDAMVGAIKTEAKSAGFGF